MRHYFLCLAGSFAASSLLLPPALAQTDTTQFNVQITINAECLINSATDLNFGESGVIDAAVDGESAIAVQCTNGTPYDIGLSAGLGDGATVAARLMTGPNLETVTYSLYTDAGHTDVWGDIIGTETLAGTGTGAEQTYPVYGQVLPQDTPTAGVYRHHHGDLDLLRATPHTATRERENAVTRRHRRMSCSRP